MVSRPLATVTQDSLAHLRLPPQSVEAEQSVLGSLLLDNLAYERVGDLLDEGSFYRYEHQLIYAAITTLVAAVKPADVITVFEQLQRVGKADECGGVAYLNALAQSIPSAANARRYAEIVRERAILRHLIAATDEIATAAFNPLSRSAQEILDEAEAKVLQVGDAGSRSANPIREADELVVSFIDRLQDLAAQGGRKVTGMRTGIVDLDEMTTGLQPGDLIVLAARPSMGKTALGLNIAEQIAVRDGLPVLVFSMEMGAHQLINRMVGSVGRVDQQHLRTGMLNDDEWGRVSEATERLARAPLAIDESAGLNPAELRARARRHARRAGQAGQTGQTGQMGAIIVDYLQLMAGSPGNEDNRATQLGEMSRGLKSLAKELNCPVIALSQLNRGVESRADKRPMMSDLRDSGAIEQDADTIMFLYRDDYYNKDSAEPGVTEVIVSKQRNGPVGTVRLMFLNTYCRFESLARQA